MNRSYRYNGKIYNTVTFLCVKLLEGYYPEKEENYQYYKRNGELSKPKTLYKYYSPEGRQYFELNKTQYDFVCYLLEKGLNTEESMLAYDKADIDHVEALKQTEQKKKHVRKQKNREKQRKRKISKFGCTKNLRKYLIFRRKL